MFAVFGSEEEKSIYEAFNEKMKKGGISLELRILSAYNTPKELEYEINDSNAEIFVAGSGLSGSLPGFVAAKKIKPVVGLPLNGNFSGLLYFLSCLQMPSGVPVLTVGVDKIDKVVSLCGNFLHGFSEIVVLKKSSGLEKKYYEKCKSFLALNKVPFSETNNVGMLDHSKVFIDFVPIGKKQKETGNIIVSCPVSENTKKADAIKLFDSMQNSFCVGVNDHVNACLAAIQLINLKGNYSELLLKLRKEEAEKTINSNKYSSLISRSAE